MCLMYVLKRFELNQHDCFDIFCALSLVTDSYKYSFLKTVVDWNTLLDCTVLLFFSLFLYSGPWFCLQSGSNGLMADNRQKNCLGILYFYIAFSSMQFLNLYMAFLGFLLPLYIWYTLSNKLLLLNIIWSVILLLSLLVICVLPEAPPHWVDPHHWTTVGLGFTSFTCSCACCDICQNNVQWKSQFWPVLYHI